MITIYKSKNQIPSSMELIELNDYFFNKTTADYLDEQAINIIAEIDGAKLLGKYKITSALNGVTLDIDKLSSGCKTVLNVLYFPDKIFNIKECGDNALDILYSLAQGNVYSEYPMISFEMESVNVIDENGVKQLNDYEDLREWWSHV